MSYLGAWHPRQTSLREPEQTMQQLVGHRHFHSCAVACGAASGVQSMGIRTADAYRCCRFVCEATTSATIRAISGRGPQSAVHVKFKSSTFVESPWLVWFHAPSTKPENCRGPLRNLNTGHRSAVHMLPSVGGEYNLVTRSFFTIHKLDHTDLNVCWLPCTNGDCYAF